MDLVTGSEKVWAMGFGFKLQPLVAPAGVASEKVGRVKQMLTHGRLRRSLSNGSSWRRGPFRNGQICRGFTYLWCREREFLYEVGVIVILCTFAGRPAGE